MHQSPPFNRDDIWSLAVKAVLSIAVAVVSIGWAGPFDKHITDVLDDIGRALEAGKFFA